MTIKIKFCGGARTVTGSMHLFTVDDTNILLDCGMYHGRRKDFFEINSHFSFNPKSVKACILSHAHIDHSGNLPSLVKKGFAGPIFSTIPTKYLCDYMLLDSGHIQEEDAKYVNKINTQKNKPLVDPLYTQKDAQETLKYFRPLEYHNRFAVNDKIDLTFFDSGHILGSAIPVLDIKTGLNTTRIAYAVDMGRDNIPLLRDREIPKDIDYLIIESTYGGRSHDNMEDAEKEFQDAINRTVARGGKIIIPSFALERAQLVLYYLNRLLRRKAIPSIPIYVDSPLTINLTKVFRDNWQYFDDETKRAFLEEHDPLGCDNVKYVKTSDESKALNASKEPMIIISASGMCENGRILHHLKNNIEDPKNMIITVGFMAQNTLGRKIVEREKIVKIFGKPCNLNAEVVTLNAFSSHADKDGLVDFVENCGDKLKKIFIVHGEETQSEALKTNLQKLNFDAIIPNKDDIVEI